MRALPTGLAFVLFAAACGTGPLSPATLDTRNDACAECRMTVSSARFASQIVVPGEEPRFFDDLGCLAAHLREGPALPARAAVYVADHRTREWAPADSAVYTKVDGLATPMGSHVVAHASPASRDGDATVRGGAPVDPHAFFGGRLPGGRP